MRNFVWTLVAFCGVASLQSTGLAHDSHHGQFAHNPSHSDPVTYGHHGASYVSPSHSAGYGSYGAGYGNDGHHSYSQPYLQGSYGHGMGWSGGAQHFTPASNYGHGSYGNYGHGSYGNVYGHGGSSWSNHW